MWVLCLPIGTAEIRANRISQAHNDGTEAVVNNAGFGLTFRDLPRATWFVQYESICNLHILPSFNVMNYVTYAKVTVINQLLG